MLIAALVLAVIGLAALVTAVVTGNEMVAWVCIAASVLGVVLLIVDAVRERQQTAAAKAGDAVDDVGEVDESAETTYENFDADYPTDEYPHDDPAETEAEASAEAPVDDTADTGTVDIGKAENDKR